VLGPAKQPLGGLPRLGGPLLVNLCGLLSDSRRPLWKSDDTKTFDTDSGFRGFNHNKYGSVQQYTPRVLGF
jgi:hypothetical protein